MKYIITESQYNLLIEQSSNVYTDKVLYDKALKNYNRVWEAYYESERIYEYYKNNDSYDYLLKMPISQLTLEKKENLEKDVSKLEIKINELKEMSIMKIWELELNELLLEWKNHKEMIEEDYENDLKGDVIKSKITKKSYQKKK